MVRAVVEESGEGHVAVRGAGVDDESDGSDGVNPEQLEPSTVWVPSPMVGEIGVPPSTVEQVRVPERVTPPVVLSVSVKWPRPRRSGSPRR